MTVNGRIGVAGLLSVAALAAASQISASPPADAEALAADGGASPAALALARALTRDMHDVATQGPAAPVVFTEASPPPSTAALAAPSPEPAPTALQGPADLQRMVELRARRPFALGADIECIAKVVYHEAANQALRGQLAVAQVILNRAKMPTFPKTVCGVVNQQGQFFQASTYVAPVGTKRWRTAVAIAAIARDAQTAQVVPGALFFHARYVLPPWSHQHERIAQVGDHIFYR